MAQEANLVRMLETAYEHASDTQTENEDYLRYILGEWQFRKLNGATQDALHETIPMILKLTLRHGARIVKGEWNVNADYNRGVMHAVCDSLSIVHFSDMGFPDIVDSILAAPNAYKFDPAIRFGIAVALQDFPEEHRCACYSYMILNQLGKDHPPEKNLFDAFMKNFSPGTQEEWDLFLNDTVMRTQSSLVGLRSQADSSVLAELHTINLWRKEELPVAEGVLKQYIFNDMGSATRLDVGTLSRTPLDLTIEDKYEIGTAAAMASRFYQKNNDVDYAAQWREIAVRYFEEVVEEDLRAHHAQETEGHQRLMFSLAGSIDCLVCSPSHNDNRGGAQRFHDLSILLPELPGYVGSAIDRRKFELATKKLQKKIETRFIKPSDTREWMETFGSHEEEPVLEPMEVIEEKKRSVVPYILATTVLFAGGAAVEYAQPFVHHVVEYLRQLPDTIQSLF